MGDAVSHLALVPDGNRRWAAARGLAPWQGHDIALRRMTGMIETAFDAGVDTVSFWWSSPANLLKRSEEEVGHIRRLIAGWLVDTAPDLLARHDAELRVHGRWRELCPELEEPVARTEGASRGRRRRRTLVVLVAYDGRDEVRAAVQAAREAGEGADFESYLWLAGLPPVDLLIRTGSADHMSAGFMLWHLADARMFFPEEMWPDYTPAHLREALAEHARHPRRHGA